MVNKCSEKDHLTHVSVDLVASGRRTETDMDTEAELNMRNSSILSTM